MTLVREAASVRTVQHRLARGVTIPAHPLALDGNGHVDVQSQRALTRYYLDAGADGVAVGVHSTQFELHDDRGLLRSVWQLAAETAGGSVGGADDPAAHISRPRADDAGSRSPTPLLIAGIVGDTGEAVAEAELAADLGYEAALLCPWGMSRTSEQTLLHRAEAVGEVLPTIGFYLQESVGGTHLSRGYWERLFGLESVIAVKAAPFDRYRTNDVLQALLTHDRWDEIAVLTGNDDTIVHDLLTPYRRTVRGQAREVRATGGLLGQWGAGTRAAARLVNHANAAVGTGAIPIKLLAAAADMVEVNRAVFDVAHDFAGCVPGVNEVLRQQGLVATANCLGPDTLSTGQSDLIREVRDRYPDMLDEQFIADHKEEWLS